MATNFKIRSLADTEFRNLFEMSQSELEEIGAISMIADKKPGFPCRVSLQDAEIGEKVILLNYEHHSTNSPYQASGPIFVRKTGMTANLGPNEIPMMLNHRFLSLRGYDKEGMMKEAVTIEGKILREQINGMFENKKVEYIHIHNAKPGCFNCVVERV